MSRPKIVGKLIPQMKGMYDSEYNYDILDEVQHSTAMYRSKRANNLGHPLTDTDWWTKTFDLSGAITPIDSPVEIFRLIGVGADGQIYSIQPEALFEYVLEQLRSYNIICASV